MLLDLVGFHFKTLRHVVTSKPCQNINLADAAGCASNGLQPTWSATASCDVHNDMCKQSSTIITYLKYLKMKMITSKDKEAVMTP